MQPVAFRRIYRDMAGAEYPATPRYVQNVLRSMAAAVDGEHAFKVRLRFADGSTATVKPKGYG